VSTSAEIRDVYRRDIDRQTLLVWKKSGPAPFYAGNDSLHIESLFGAKCGDGDTVVDWKRPDYDRECED
jgi:hypothetical protein